jgi:acrylyl-CoA reductase (NADPH)
MFKCIYIDKSEVDYHVELTELDDSLLSEGDVAIDVQFSSLNYKDALAITGKSPVVRRSPMIPGIDLAGTVAYSSHPELSPGMSVVANGWGLGETHWGGLAQKARLNGDWLVPMPPTLHARQAMAIGTAGYTAMLCVMALERNDITPDKGEVLVTGAAGGVGGFAVAILAKLGYDVVALSGRPETSEYIKNLGAARIMHRSELSSPGKPLARERWAGVVDVVGSHVLANACASTKYGGVVTACGLAGGIDLPATVAPFILRGISLVGIDSVMCPRETRREAWRRLEQDLDLANLEDIAQEIGLTETIETAKALLSGKIRGRVVVDVNR